MADYKIVRKKANKERKKKNRRRFINQDIFKVTIFFALIFFAMVVFLVKFLAFDSSSVINNSYNKRTASLKNSITRGSIYSADGNLLAYTETDDSGEENRVYPYGQSFCHVVGFEENGGLGIESSYNYYLLTSHTNILSKIRSEFSGSKVMGDSIVTTLDTGLQLKANEILGDNEGAIVVINPSTGEILAMASNPGFDPNTIDEEWDSIVNDSSNSVLLNRATQAELTPGSTFKIFTLLEYYREKNGQVSDFEYNCQGYVEAGDTILSCPNGNAHGWQDLKMAFANSCNCVFSTIGKTLDITEFAADNESLLFNTDLDLDIATNESSFSLTSDSSEFMIMQTCFGQGETLVSPIHLAMIASSVANGGTLMRPHLVSSVVDENGNTVQNFGSEVYAQLMTEDEASFLKEYMRAVVTDGTAKILSYDGNYISYGKTGTAETNSDKSSNYDHSWFTGFAENDGNSIAVCAMIENTQEAGITGVYAAKQIFDYWFN